jgi:disulfide bond formation protein DsbB
LIIIFLGFAFLIFKKEIIFLYLSLLIFFINFFISIFHSLVERGFVNYSSSCTSNNNNFEDIESLRQSLENTPIAKCDEIIFSVMGLSLANINLIVLTLLIIINILFIVRNDKI